METIPSIVGRRVSRMVSRMAIVAAFAFVLAGCASSKPDPLPSWNKGPARQSVVAFVEKVTKEGSPDFVPPAERVATFDNDGTLWAEQPMYFQFFFAMDRVKAMAPQHPEWKYQEPFASLLKGDMRSVMGGGERALMEIIMVTHAGMTTSEFEKLVKDWVATARHPVTRQPYTSMVYKPMVELLAYMRDNGFKTYIVSGGGVEFMRPWAEAVYGIPPEQVVGSSIKTRWEVRDGKPALVRLPEVNFIDDKTGKPVGINERIGRRPIAAFGNSEGDQEMLEWTQAGSTGSPRLMVLVHHDDAVREWAYGPASPIGTFSDELMAEAKKQGWTVISMKSDWKQIFPFGNK